MINNLEDAFKILESRNNGIPFDAIQYVYTHPPDERITKKILFFLSHAYDEEVIYDFDSDYYSSSPLWYAIIAENHFSENIIDPVINLFTKTNDTWDFLDEQGMYLIGLLCEKYTETIVPIVFKRIEELSDKDSPMSYHYLFDFLYFVDLEVYKERILKILSGKLFKWYDAFAIQVANLQIKEAIPILNEKLKGLKSKNPEWTEKMLVTELKEAVRQLETGINLYPDQSKAYYITRGDWLSHYKSFNKSFKE